jgi:uncharacterized protein YjbI with pentapeptide repeats
MDAAMLSDVLETLAQGRSLSGLPVALHNGRIDVRGANLSTLGVKRHFGAPLPPQAQGPVGKFAGLVMPCVVPLSLRGIELRDIDFSGSNIDGIRFFNCTIRNCVFDNASCEGWRIWATSVSDSSFSSASLRGAVLGGALDGESNRFENVRFVKTNLRQTVHGSAVFLGCTFDNANLLKVDFQGSRFVQCVFRGELREVMFYDRAFRGEGFPPNMMEDVDLSGASLRSVEFRRLNLDHVKFPADSEHLMLSNYPVALDYGLAQLREDDVLSRRMRGYLEFRRKWIGPKQTVGVFNRLDLLELFGEDGRARLEGLLRVSPSGHVGNQPE